MRKGDSGLVERLVRKRVIYRGKMIDFRVDVVRLPDGRTATREFLDHPGAVGVVPFLDPETIVMVRQYRHPVGRVTLELPAGKIDHGESVVACVRRELREETGCTARTITPLLRYWPTPAFANEILHLYVAQGLRPGRMRTDADEFLQRVDVPFRKAVRMVLSGEIQDSKTVIGILVCAARGHYTTS